MRVLLSVLFFPLFAACAASPEDRVELGAAEADLSSALIGAYEGQGAIRKLVFLDEKSSLGGPHTGNKRLIAEIDNDVRCPRAPCEPTRIVGGSFSATRGTIDLVADASNDPAGRLGRFSYRVEPSSRALRLERDGASETLSRLASHCYKSEQCMSQGLTKPSRVSCAGNFVCTFDNTCEFECGAPLPPGPICGRSSCAWGETCCDPLRVTCAPRGERCADDSIHD